MTARAVQHAAARLAAVELTDAARTAGDRRAEERVYEALACGHFHEVLAQLRALRAARA